MTGIMIERIFAEVDAETAEIPPMDAAQIAYATRCVQKALLHRTTVMQEVLEECRDYFDQRADADGDDSGYTGNEEMKLLVLVDQARHSLCGMAHDEPSMSGMQQSSDMVEHVLEAAEYDEFQRALDNPPRPNEALKKLVARVARAVEDAPFDAWSIAEAALEASHHAELVEALEEARLIVANLPHDESLFLAKIDAALDRGNRA